MVPLTKAAYAFVGYGMPVPLNQNVISPVLTTKSKVATRVPMQPLPAFFLAMDSTFRGYIVDKASYPQTASIDFTAQPGKPYARVTYSDTGLFSVKYSKTPQYS